MEAAARTDRSMSAASATASRPRSVRDTTWLRRSGAPLPGDVAVGFQPAEGLAHGLRLYAHQLGKLRLWVR